MPGRTPNRPEGLRHPARQALRRRPKRRSFPDFFKTNVLGYDGNIIDGIGIIDGLLVNDISHLWDIMEIS